MQETNHSVKEAQLEGLRTRLKDIRTAKHWLQEYRVNASAPESTALVKCFNWLDQQERNTIAMAKRIKDS